MNLRSPTLTTRQRPELHLDHLRNSIAFTPSDVFVKTIENDYLLERYGAGYQLNSLINLNNTYDFLKGKVNALANEVREHY